MKRIANYLLTATALLGAAALLTFAAKNDFGLARNMETLVNMMRELSVYYVDEVDADRLMTDAAEGMVRRLDPYTVYMPEEEMTDFQFLTTGKYGGVGALIRKKGDGVVVAQPYKGFPADRAGLQIGDRFVEIAGKDARGMTTEQVSALLKGTPNTNVTIKVEKLLTGQVEEVKLRRERIAISGVGYAGFVADSIGYIQHRDFTEGCYEDMRAALEGLQKQGLKALVLDYRNNGGGIMPDERIDPEYISRFAMTLYAMGYVDDFADLYFREHGMQRIDPRTFTLTDADYERFEQFMADKEVKYESDTRRALNRIKEAARADLYEESLAAEIEAIEAGIRDDKATNLQTYKREIMETLNGAVILRYSYAEGVTEHTLTEDREVHRAVALLDDGKEYARILHEQDTVRK